MNKIFKFCIFLYGKVKIFSLMLFIFCILSSLPLQLKAEDETDTEKLFNPENSSWLYAYGGYGYYRWKMMSPENFVDLFTSNIPSTGMRFKHDSTPYTVKKYGIKSNFFLFSLGFDYLGNTLSLPTEFDSEKEMQKNENNKVKQMRYLSGIRFGNLSLQFNVTQREFDSTITSKGYKVTGGNVYDIYYYPQSGGSQTLAPGEQIAWYTLFTDYEAKLSYSLYSFTMDLGFRYMKYNSPTELSISENSAQGDILLYSENKVKTAFIGIGTYSRLAGDFYFHMYVPASFIGLYDMKNNYFRTDDSGSHFSFVVSSSGNASIAYLLNHLKVEGGVDYGMYYSSLILDDVKLKQDISYIDDLSESVQTAHAGDKVDINVSRIEFFWGFYLNASVYF